MTDTLAAFVHALVAPQGPFLNAGLVLQRQGQPLWAFAAGALRPRSADAFTLNTPLRFASVSKAVTARAAIALSQQGRLDLDRPAAEFIAAPLPRHVTARSLLSHTSGVTDAGGYLIDFPETLSAFIVRLRKQSMSAPGWFSYSNLGYVILGAIIEKASGHRFDEAVNALVLKPLGMTGRFAWHGMSAQERALAGPIARREAAGFSVQIDGAVPAEGLHDRNGQPIDLCRSILGEHSAIFGPHAGLRISLQDAAKLAVALADGSDLTLAQIAPLWRHDPHTNNGDATNGLFTGYGAGVQIHPPSDWYSRSLVGHFGNAYGAACGVWADRDRGASFAFMLNGMPHRRTAEDRETFYTVIERDLFKAFDRALS